MFVADDRQQLETRCSAAARRCSHDFVQLGGPHELLAHALVISKKQAHVRVGKKLLALDYR